MKLSWIGFLLQRIPSTPPGVLNRDLLASPLQGRLRQSDGEDACQVCSIKRPPCSTLWYNNHAFHDGNKRVALIAAQVFLTDENHWLDYASDEEMFEFTRRAASHELTKRRSDEPAYISEWFQANSRRIVKGEHPMKFGELKEALARFDLTLGPPEGEFIDIYDVSGNRIDRIIDKSGS